MPGAVPGAGAPHHTHPENTTVSSAAPRSRRRTPSISSLLLALLAALALASSPVRAQDPKVLTVDDYSRWRTINEESLSNDGRWVAWVYRYTNVARDDQDSELHLLNLRTSRDTAIADAYSVVFSPDARWVAFQVDSTPENGGRGGNGNGGQGASSRRGNGGSSTHHRIELRELATGRTLLWHDMQSATFSPDSKFTLLRDRAASRGRGRFGGFGGFGGGGSGDDDSGSGSDAVLLNLATGRGQLLGSVGDAAFNRAGTLLAYTVDGEVKDANGLYVVDLATGAPHALHTDALTYAQMAWNADGSGIAVLKGDDVEDMLHANNTLLVFPDVQAALRDPSVAPMTLDTTAAGFPDGWVINDGASLTWSEDGRRIFLGAMPQLPASDTVTVEASDSTADVDIWGTADRYVQSVQFSMASRERNYAYRQAFDVRRGAFVALSDSTMRDLEVSPDGRWAVGTDARTYISDWQPDSADFYRVDPATGERTLMLEGQLARGAYGLSPDGRTFLYWADHAFHAYDVARGTSTTLGEGAPVFTDTVWDYTGPKPPWGVAGYTADGRSVIVEDRYDLWTLPLDGGRATNITNGYGAEHRIILRLTRTEPIDSAASRAVKTGRVYDLSKPVTLSAFGELTKRDGYYRLARGRLSEVVYDDAQFSTPRKAKNADRYLFTRQSFTEPPNLQVSDADFSDADQVTDSNPQQSEYRWGHTALIDYQDRFGHPLQGMLWIPDDYQEGQQRPMLVVFYEKQTQNLNRYPMPELFVSAGRASIEAVSRGYIVLAPDVYYNTGSSHSDQMDGVEAATRKAIELGYADPDHIGLHGHSYAGEGAQYIGTRSDLFAAVCAGAGVTDLYTDFNQHWGWSYQNSGGGGANGTGYYMYSQGRWGFSPWEQPEVYHSESALTHADEATQPFLLMHGTADPTVGFNETLKFYNALRFNGKTAWLLAYRGEGHHLSELGNRKDFTARFYEFFGHYLMDEPEPEWMARGRPFLEKTGTPESEPEDAAADAGSGDETGGARSAGTGVEGGRP